MEWSSTTHPGKCYSATPFLIDWSGSSHIQGQMGCFDGVNKNYATKKVGTEEYKNFQDEPQRGHGKRLAPALF